MKNTNEEILILKSRAEQESSQLLQDATDTNNKTKAEAQQIIHSSKQESLRISSISKDRIHKANLMINKLKNEINTLKIELTELTENVFNVKNAKKEALEKIRTIHSYTSKTINSMKENEQKYRKTYQLFIKQLQRQIQQNKKSHDDKLEYLLTDFEKNRSNLIITKKQELTNLNTQFIQTKEFMEVEFNKQLIELQNQHNKQLSANELKYKQFLKESIISHEEFVKTKNEEFKLEYQSKIEYLKQTYTPLLESEKKKYKDVLKNIISHNDSIIKDCTELVNNSTIIQA